MIIQSSNKPIKIEFSDDVTDSVIRVTLWSNTGTKLKEWTRNDVTINEKVVICPLTQEETKCFPAGETILEVKWLENGITEFSDKFKIIILSRKDTTVMEVSND